MSVKPRIRPGGVVGNINGYRRKQREAMHRRKPMCWYCGRSIALHVSTIDHIIPLSKGGVESRKNYALACVSCNQKKANRLLSEAGMRLVVGRR